MLIVVTPAAIEPVSLDEAKAHLRIVHSYDDALIAAHISAARDRLEQNTGRALAVATYRCVSDGCTALPTRLPLWPAGSIANAEYTDADGVQQPVAGAVLDADLGLVRAAAPGPYNRFAVEFTTAPGNVPPPLIAAIKLLVADMYENAEANVVGSIVAQNPTVDALIFPYRMNLGV